MELQEVSSGKGSLMAKLTTSKEEQVRKAEKRVKEVRGGCD